MEVAEQHQLGLDKFEVNFRPHIKSQAAGNIGWVNDLKQLLKQFGQPHNSEALYREGQSRLYLLRSLKSFGVQVVLLTLKWCSSVMLLY